MTACYSCPTGKPKRPATYLWTSAVSGNTMPLCTVCCACWRANAQAEPDLRPSRIRTLTSGDWQDRALCQETDPEEFFPEKGGSSRAAKRVCRSCEVQTECLEYALLHDIRFGIWGGTSERERRALKRRTA